MKIIKITSDNKDLYNDKLFKFEQVFTYQLGEIKYKIDHGQDYFAFFERMGELVAYIALDDEENIAALAVGVLRSVNLVEGKPAKKVWYIADLKVAPNYRGQRLTHTLIRRAFIDNFSKAQKIYALTINSLHQKVNHIAQFAPRLPLLPLKVSSTILLYLCSYDEIKKIEPSLKSEWGMKGYITVQPLKSLIVEGTSEAIPILHVHYDDHKKLIAEPHQDFNHMFCLEENNPLVEQMKSLGINPITTASALYYGVGNSDWRFMITSEI